MNFLYALTFTYKDVILPLTLATCAASGIAPIAEKALQPEEREGFKNDMKALSQEKYTTLKTMGFLIVLGLCIGLPLFYLPLSFGIPLAIVGGGLTIKMALNTSLFKQKFDAVVQTVKKAFTQQPEESDEEHRKRLIKNICIILAVVGTIVGISVGSYFFMNGIMEASKLNPAGWWNIMDLLPIKQTCGVVFAEYALLGVAHIAFGIKCLKQKKWGPAFFHFFSAMAAFAFPTFYWLKSAFGGETMRLHHSFIGLFLQLFPFTPVKMFGSIITLDAFINCLTPRLHQYDFQNILIENLGLYLIVLTAASAFEVLFTRWSNKNKS